jgi:hypothetical protein
MPYEFIERRSSAERNAEDRFRVIGEKELSYLDRVPYRRRTMDELGDLCYRWTIWKWRDYPSMPLIREFFILIHNPSPTLQLDPAKINFLAFKILLHA